MDDKHKWQLINDLATTIDESVGRIRAWARHYMNGNDAEVPVEKTRANDLVLYRVDPHPEDGPCDGAYRPGDGWRIEDRGNTIDVVRQKGGERDGVVTFWPGRADVDRERLVEMATGLRDVFDAIEDAAPAD